MVGWPHVVALIPSARVRRAAEMRVPISGAVVSTLFIALSAAVNAWSLVFGEAPGPADSLLTGRVLPAAMAAEPCCFGAPAAGVSATW